MKKWLIIMMLASIASTNAIANTPQLNQGKQEFNVKSQKFMQALNQSIAKMNQKQRAIQQSQQKLQGYRSPNNTPVENQCLNAMIHRANNTQTLVRNMLARLQHALKQMPLIRTRAQQARTPQQLDQAAAQVNQLIDQLNSMGDKNNQLSQQLTKNVDNICSRLPK